MNRWGRFYKGEVGWVGWMGWMGWMGWWARARELDELEGTRARGLSWMECGVRVWMGWTRG